MDERPITGTLDEDAIRAGAVRVSTMFNLDGTTTIEWTDINGNTIFEPTLEYGVTADQMDDMREWDRENDAHHAVYRRDYDNAYWRLEHVFCFGGWDTSDDDGEPEIKEERGGALDEFLDEFKPQTTHRKK